MYNSPGFSDVYRVGWEKLQKRIMSEADPFILGTPTDQLVEYYLPDDTFDLIEIDDSVGMSFEHRKNIRKVSASERGRYSEFGDTEFEYESIVITIPILTNLNINDFTKIRTSTISMGWSPKDGDIRPTEIIVEGGYKRIRV